MVSLHKEYTVHADTSSVLVPQKHPICGQITRAPAIDTKLPKQAPDTRSNSPCGSLRFKMSAGKKNKRLDS